MPRNVFIQIGLNKSFEYAFLADPDFAQVALEDDIVNSKYYCPKILLEASEPYTVVGIDMNPDKNKILRETYTPPNLHIWDYVIWHEDVKEFSCGDYVASDDYLPEGKKHGWQFKVPAITFTSLVEKIKELPDHADAVIKGVHVNIEGSEVNLLRGLDWSDIGEKPVVFRVAVNHYVSVRPDVNKRSPGIVSDLMVQNGYYQRTDERDQDEFLSFYRIAYNI